jgi:hypothetical protein
MFQGSVRLCWIFRLDPDWSSRNVLQAGKADEAYFWDPNSTENIGFHRKIKTQKKQNQSKQKKKQKTNNNKKENKTRKNKTKHKQKLRTIQVLFFLVVF